MFSAGWRFLAVPMGTNAEKRYAHVLFYGKNLRLSHIFLDKQAGVWYNMYGYYFVERNQAI